MSNQPNRKKKNGVFSAPFMFIWSIFKSTEKINPEHLLECLVVQNMMLFVVAVLEFIQDDMSFTLEVIALLVLLIVSIIISWNLLGQPLTAKDFNKRCEAYKRKCRAPRPSATPQSPRPSRPATPPSPRPTHPTPATPPSPPPIPTPPTPTPKQSLTFESVDIDGVSETIQVDEKSNINDMFESLAPDTTPDTTPTPLTPHTVRKVHEPIPTPPPSPDPTPTPPDPTPLTPPASTTVILDDDSEDIPMLDDDPSPEPTSSSDGFLESSSDNDIGFEESSKVSDYMQSEVVDISQFNSKIETQAIGGTVDESLIKTTVTQVADEMEDI